MRVLRIFLLVSVVAALCGPALAVARKPSTTKKASSTKTVKTARKAPVRKASSKKAAVKRTPAKTSTKTAASKKSKGRVTARRRSFQGAPTPERYQEIQQALASRGLYQGEANGNWGPDSVDALKRFQQEQNLAPSGKLDSMTLIALGLGPKRNLAAGSIPNPNTLPRPQDDNRRSQGSERP